jgi:mRNA-degrading endonuclease toxin of MazEF toxin-antitoxin module
MCDNLVSLQKSDLTYFVGSSARLQMAELDRALKMALELD